MSKAKKTFLYFGIAILCLATASLPAANQAVADFEDLTQANTVGSISQILGSVSLYRDGKAVKPLKLGQAILNDDKVQTGANSGCDIELDPSTGMKGSISVKQNTCFYFRLDDQDGEASSIIDLMGGSLDASLKKLDGAPSFQVKTQTAVMGVRGTVFRVITSVRGSVLVDCDEGEVSCVDIDEDTEVERPGSAIRAIPGQAFERRTGEGAIAIKYANRDEWQKSRDSWAGEEVDRFKKDAAPLLIKLAKKYMLKAEQFTKDLLKLKASKAYALWLKEELSGTIMKRTPEQKAKEREELMPLVEKLIESGVALEGISQRLIDILPFIDEKIGRISLGAISAQGFFKKFEEMRETIERGIVEARHARLLFAERNGGKGPGIDFSLKARKAQ